MRYLLLSLFSLIVLSCGQPSQKSIEKSTANKTIRDTIVQHPDWSKNATMYELNIRQFSETGDFKAIVPELPRLRNMGVDIIWLMPIHPIGLKNRKHNADSKGSYYSVQNYLEVNPDYGTKEDFANLVSAIHKNGMKVIIDWVANHTSWDNPWIENEGWYTLDSNGQMMPPVPDWSDVADLNYDNYEMREAMIDAMTYWVSDYDIDGYRCDVAMMVPTDFWIDARNALDKIKPVFMLAEAEDPDLHKAFDATYAWKFHHIMNEISKGEMRLSNISEYLEIKEPQRFGQSPYRLTFTTNHDENSWNGTVFERFGNNHKAFAVLAFTAMGMPLLYSGQEAGLNHRLRFFEKDTIDWKDYPLQEFYGKLLRLHQRNKSLWNGNSGGQYIALPTANPESILAYMRMKEDDVVIVLINFSDTEQKMTMATAPGGKFLELFSDKEVTLKDSETFELQPHGFMVFEKTHKE